MVRLGATPEAGVNCAVAENQVSGAPPDDRKADWVELFRDGRGTYTALLNLGIALHALDVFIITTIMPSVIADIGGLSYYTWTNLLYMVGSITGAASGAYMHSRFGGRRGYFYGGIVLLVGTVGCSIAPDMASLLVARTVKGFGGGLVMAQSMALIRELYEPRIRTRILALVTTTWSVAAVLGPALGGVFAEIGWWRGAFWATTPFVLGFLWLAWRSIPDAPPAGSTMRLPWRRLASLTLGVVCVGVTSVLDNIAATALLLIAAIALVWLTFRLDEISDHRLFPSKPMSFVLPVGTAYWIFFLISVTHSALLIFTPLFLQVLHGLTPLYIGYLSLVFSFGWTAGALIVSGWSGRLEHAGSVGGMLLTALCTAIMAAEIVTGSLMLISVVITVAGVGIGATNVVATAWGMAVARPGEENVTASSMPMIRSLGVAFGAAGAGLVANAAGLSGGTAPDTVANVAVWVLGLTAVVPVLAAGFALRAAFFPSPAAIEAAE